MRKNDPEAVRVVIKINVEYKKGRVVIMDKK